MPEDSALYKRIKRHVIGRRRSYFVVVSPGFEPICHRELSALGLSDEDAVIVDGGVEFTGQLLDCYRANLHLRTANRILLRIDRFKATNFRQLENKVAEIAWELYLPPQGLPDIQVTTRHCRLYHTAAVTRHFIAGIDNHWKHIGFRTEAKDPAPAGITVFVRGIDDRFTVSIDSSGNHLHKRGLKRHYGKAPLRETTAAAALLLTGYDRNEPLIDPMCGTGTFSLEAALMAKNIPPGWYREFAFMLWPSFSRKRWEYLKQQSANQIIQPPRPVIFASDQDASACRRLEKCIQQNRLSETITVSCMDFFNMMPQELTDQAGMVVINPPYGIRLGSHENSERLFGAIGARLYQAYKGWKVVLVAPDKKLIPALPFKLAVQPFFHGGLRAALLYGEVA